jgi:hypothetical protein
MKFEIKNFEDEVLFRSNLLDDLIPSNIEGRLFVDGDEVCYVYVFEPISIRSVLMKIKNKIKDVRVEKYRFEKEIRLLDILETSVIIEND